MTTALIADRKPDIIDLLIVANDLHLNYERLLRLVERCPGSAMAIKEIVPGIHFLVGASITFLVKGDATNLAISGQLDDHIVPLNYEGEADLFIAATYLKTTVSGAGRAILTGFNNLLDEIDQSGSSSYPTRPRIVSVVASSSNQPALRKLYGEILRMTPISGTWLYHSSYQDFSLYLRLLAG